MYVFVVKGYTLRNNSCLPLSMKLMKHLKGMNRGVQRMAVENLIMLLIFILIGIVALIYEYLM